MQESYISRWKSDLVCVIQVHILVIVSDMKLIDVAKMQIGPGNVSPHAAIFGNNSVGDTGVTTTRPPGGCQAAPRKHALA